MKILPLFILLACIAWPARAQEEEPRAAPARGLLKRGPLAKGKTTTTTPAPAQDEAEYDEEGDYPADGEAQEPATEAPVTSTTEGKKLVAGGVRPFRSNTELLELLKRRKAQAAEAKHNGGSSAASQSADTGSEAAKSNYNAKSKKRFNNAPVTREVSDEDAPPAPAKPSRGRFGRPATRSVQEPEEEQNDAAPPVKNARNFRRGGN